MIEYVKTGEKITANKQNQIINVCNKVYDGSTSPKIDLYSNKGRKFLRAVPYVDCSDPESPKSTYLVYLGAYNKLEDNLKKLLDDEDLTIKGLYTFADNQVEPLYTFPIENIVTGIGWKNILVPRTQQPETLSIYFFKDNNDVWLIFGTETPPKPTDNAELTFTAKLLETVPKKITYHTDTGTVERNVVEYCEFELASNTLENGIEPDHNATGNRQSSIQIHTVVSGDLAGTYEEIYDFHDLSNQINMPVSSDWGKYDLLFRHHNSAVDNKVEYMQLSTLMNAISSKTIDLSALPGDSDVLPNDDFDIGSIHKANDYYELHHFNDNRKYPWNGQDLFNVQNEYWDFDNNVKVKTPYQSIQDYGNIGEQETQFLVKTTLSNGGNNDEHQSLEYRKLNLDLKLPYCDSYLAMNAMGSNYSIELGSAQTSQGKELPYFQLNGFNYQADVQKVIQLDWPNEEGTTGTYNLGTTIQRHIAENNRYIEYDNIILQMPQKPDTHDEDITNIYNYISNLEISCTTIIEDINNIWSRIQELEDRYWLRNGDYTTCFGQSIGDSDGNLKIDLMSKVDDDSYYQDVAVEGSFKANYVKAQTGMYIGATFISEEQLQQLLALIQN